jgi:hypothetical protein
MAFTQKRLAGALNSSASQLVALGSNVYTPSNSPTSTTAIVKQILLCNTTASAKTVSIYILPTSATVGDSYALFKDVSLDAKETLILNTSIVLTGAAGDRLHMVASADTSITATVFGIEEI